MKQPSTVRRAWQEAERRFASYLGTTRAGIGFSGQDLREAPEVEGWLSQPHWFTHVMGESKCDGSNATLLKAWHACVQEAKPKEPVMLIEDPSVENERLVLFTGEGLKRFLLLLNESVSEAVWGLLDSHVRRYRRANGYDRVVSYFDQVSGYAVEWLNRTTTRQSLAVLPIVYLTYPNRTSEGFCIRIGPSGPIGCISTNGKASYDEIMRLRMSG